MSRRRLRKWFFSLNEGSAPEYEDLAKAAVRSCLKNTSLAPHCVYDGTPNAFTRWLTEHGVTVQHHKAAFLDPLCDAAQCNEEYRSVARGAFLRVEIPLLERSETYVLYTDVDALFLQDVADLPLAPAFFACAPQFSPTDYSYFNSGVMLMNAHAMRREYRGLLAFIRAGFPHFEAFDQGALNQYFADRWERLPAIYNWKPYWGDFERAKILHFHGPKPALIERWLNNEASSPP
jgi:lipopolysaccharide biosynthesis glycosyltransferase